MKQEKWSQKLKLCINELEVENLISLLTKAGNSPGVEARNLTFVLRIFENFTNKSVKIFFRCTKEKSSTKKPGNTEKFTLPVIQYHSPPGCYSIVYSVNDTDKKNLPPEEIPIKLEEIVISIIIIMACDSSTLDLYNTYATSQELLSNNVNLSKYFYRLMELL